MGNYRGQRGERESQGQTCLPPPLPPHPPLSFRSAAAGVFSGQRSEVKGEREETRSTERHIERVRCTH